MARGLWHSGQESVRGRLVDSGHMFGRNGRQRVEGGQGAGVCIDGTTIHKLSIVVRACLGHVKRHKPLLV